MNKFFRIILFTFLTVQAISAQDLILKDKNSNRSIRSTDTSSVANSSASKIGIKNEDATIDLYKIISFKKDTTIVDTSLTIKKEYKFNYLRKDNFELISFSNIGQSYNTLSFNFKNTSTLPLFGARAKHFNYFELNDINYYSVPTPFTELMFKTAFEQGQLLDAFFTVNTSKQFNFSIAYKGLRSLGNYQNILTSTGNFRFTTNYHTKNNKYNMRAHIVMQDLSNEENGGLSDDDVLNFENGDPEFIDRSVFSPNFENAENILEGKRFHLEHQYQLSKTNDSINKGSIFVGNILTFKDKYYQFTQTNVDDYFGDAFLSSNIKDKVKLEHFKASGFINYNSKLLGDLKVNLDYHNYNYGYDALVEIEDNLIINRIKGSIVSFGGAYQKQINNFKLEGEFGLNISGDFNGNFLNASAGYKVNDDLSFNASLNSSSKVANYNHLLYQSDYLNYNWDNSSSYNNIETQQLAFNIASNKLINLTADFTRIDNYTYFIKNELDLIKSTQADNTVSYFRLKANREIKFGKFALDNTILYQNVSSGEEHLNVPDFITRNTIYYSSNIFKNAMYLQTGITLNYFSDYNMNGYDPLLSEFYVQDDVKLGGSPRLDFFLNAKIRQTRIYLKAEHFNAAFTGYNYYSAPKYPYRDFKIRFGIVWNFFL
ncbi:putative porin [Lacinutrix undariae]